MTQFYIKHGLVRGQVADHDGHNGGYRYMPFDSAHRSSRKAHATPEAAIRGRISGGRLVEARNVAEALIIAAGGNPV